MIKILANDGIDAVGQKILEEAGFVVDTQTIPQEELPAKLNAYDAILVRSATKVRKDLIDQCPNLKLIGRGGVGMDNIDVEYAKSKGLAVYNTPAASSASVAELVFAHLFNGNRFLNQANRKMPVEGASQFNNLKKAYGKGVELSGKTIGIVGFGRIGKATAKVALGLGMRVLAFDVYDFDPNINLTFAGGQSLDLKVETANFDTLLKESDFITLHIPFAEQPVLGAAEFAQMKNGVGVVNCARGGVIDELALLEALNSGKVAFAGLDVFENEPTPRAELLQHDKISLSPHIGAATNEAQERIGVEIAELIKAYFQQ